MRPSSTSQQKKAAAFRRGLAVFVILALLTAFEFWVSRVTAGSAALLFIIALVKAGLILNYFMHVSSLWSEEAHG